MNKDDTPLVNVTPIARHRVSPQKSENARLTLIEHLYYQTKSADNPEIHQQMLSEDMIYEDEQPFLRTWWVKEEWEPLPTGWLKEGSVLVIYNRGHGDRDKNPTEEESKAELEALIELGIDPNPIDTNKRDMHSPPRLEIITISTIPLQRSVRVSPDNLGMYRIRCKKGKAKAQLLLFPR